MAATAAASREYITQPLDGANFVLQVQNKVFQGSDTMNTQWEKTKLDDTTLNTIAERMATNMLEICMLAQQILKTFRIDPKDLKDIKDPEVFRKGKSSVPKSFQVHVFPKIARVVQEKLTISFPENFGDVLTKEQMLSIGSLVPCIDNIKYVQGTNELKAAYHSDLQAMFKTVLKERLASEEWAKLPEDFSIHEMELLDFTFGSDATLSRAGEIFYNALTHEFVEA